MRLIPLALEILVLSFYDDDVRHCQSYVAFNVSQYWAVVNKIPSVLRPFYKNIPATSFCVKSDDVLLEKPYVRAKAWIMSRLILL